VSGGQYTTRFEGLATSRYEAVKDSGQQGLWVGVTNITDFVRLTGTPSELGQASQGRPSSCWQVGYAARTTKLVRRGQVRRQKHRPRTPDAEELLSSMVEAHRGITQPQGGQDRVQHHSSSGHPDRGRSRTRSRG